MRWPQVVYQIQEQMAQHLGHRRPAQQEGLALWVYGTVLAGSAGQNAVLAALAGVARWHSLRQRLREWRSAGADRLAPCQTQVDGTACLAPLLRWGLAWGAGDALTWAVDTTAHTDRWVAFVVRVFYQGTAIPVAWHIRGGNQSGRWMEPILELLEPVAQAGTGGRQVLVRADRGLWSPALFAKGKALGWHPLRRGQLEWWLAPEGEGLQPARRLVTAPGPAWVGRARIFKTRPRPMTVIVVWAEGQQDPEALGTDLAPEAVGGCWYGMRMWIELGFRALKRCGWHWEQTRRSDLERVARHWLVMALAALWGLAEGTRQEEAEAAGLPPGRLHQPRPIRTGYRRYLSLWQRGLLGLRQGWQAGRFWRRWWLTFPARPTPPATWSVYIHAPPLPKPPGRADLTMALSS